MNVKCPLYQPGMRASLVKVSRTKEGHEHKHPEKVYAERIPVGYLYKIEWFDAQPVDRNLHL
jgi:hypothetical protein